MQGDGGNNIERLKRTLYSKTKKQGESVRHALRKGGEQVSHTWTKGGERVPYGAEALAEASVMPKKKVKWYKTGKGWLIAASLFFLVSLTVAAGYVLLGENIVSSRNVAIEVDGPASIRGGETLDVQITITNNNNTPLQLADLIVEYPEGTRNADDMSRELRRTRESLGTIAPGDQVTQTARSVIFGGEGDTKEVGITVEYRVPDSNAILFSEGVYEVGISSAPLSLSVDGAGEMVSGKEMTLTVTVVNNTESIIENLLLRAEYPFGFVFDGGTPEPQFSDNVWALGDVPAGAVRTIKINGALSGEDGAERIFRFASGVASEADERELSADFAVNRHAIAIQRPFIGLELALNGSEGQTYIAQAGETIRGDITWRNNTSDEVRDAEVELALSGSALDRSSVSVQGGFYNSNTRTIRWSRETVSALESLAPGETGQASFTLSSLRAGGAAPLVNPRIVLETNISGQRLSQEQQAPERVDATLTREIKVSSGLALLARSVYSIGPFANRGPVPPAAERETTYTVLWTLTNTANTVSDAAVTATLPSYMTWMHATDPASEDISYNAVSGTVTWEPGTLEPSDRAEVAFQVSLLPSSSQVGVNPVVLGEQTIQGFDQFIEERITRTSSALTTSIVTDPIYTQNAGTVVSGGE